MTTVYFVTVHPGDRPDQADKIFVQFLAEPFRRGCPQVGTAVQVEMHQGRFDGHRFQFDPCLCKQLPDTAGTETGDGMKADVYEVALELKRRRSPAQNRFFFQKQDVVTLFGKQRCNAQPCDSRPQNDDIILFHFISQFGGIGISFLGC